VRAGREWVGLAVLALPCLLVAIDFTVLNLAVPRLSADLRPTSSQLPWMVESASSSTCFLGERPERTLNWMRASTLTFAAKSAFGP